MRNIHDVLREKEAEVEKLTREVKLLRVAGRILEDDSPSQPAQAAEAMSQHATTAILNFADGTVLPTSDGDVSKRVH
jgi:hypothetical protein